MAKEKGQSGKDRLFSKILPALNDNPFSTTYEGAKKEETAPRETEDSLSALRNKLFGRSDTYTSDTYVTINVMENMVLRHIDEVIQRFNTCSCDRCHCDVAAYALNHLPAKYIVADPTRMTKVEEEISTKQVMDALVNAVIQVRAKPRH